ncbi:hypothetical protein [Candidatus Marithrix sp. Canyon 246]|uniref:hypothetical protein n=1 Tax=Candidatus Marithrix sp. Canyon 246 TaxID=1827136 RepID=UPI000849FFFB|nr:hypothetical protein [Candidatus Marithrix sp. Canyon 246]
MKTYNYLQLTIITLLLWWINPVYSSDYISDDCVAEYDTENGIIYIPCLRVYNINTDTESNEVIGYSVPNYVVYLQKNEDDSFTPTNLYQDSNVPEDTECETLYNPYPPAKAIIQCISDKNDTSIYSLILEVVNNTFVIVTE